MYIKRVYARYEIRGFVTMIPVNNTAHIIKADFNEVCYGGFSALAKEKLEPGMAVEFDLLPELLGEHIKGKAKVKYISGTKKFGRDTYLIGLEFIEVNKAAIVSLMNIYRARANQTKRETQKPKRGYDLPF